MNKKIYFVSDIHLGLNSYEDSLKREKLMVELLDEIKDSAEELFLLGDIFDFWVDKGFAFAAIHNAFNTASSHVF